jgi:dihydroorotase
MHEGVVSTRIGLRGISEASELIGASRLAALALDSGARLCIGPISSAQSVSFIPKNASVDISVACRSLILKDEDIEISGYDPSFHLSPPLRSDPKSLKEVASTERITIFLADHHPLSRVEKDKEFSISTPGAMGIETAISAAYSAIGSLYILVEKLVEGPAKLCGLSKGLQIGSDVDIVIFDSNVRWRPTSPYCSKGINEPLEGHDLHGRVLATIIGENWFSNNH